jgi:tetratricopeptide (TPR) repeat protein
VHIQKYWYEPHESREESVRQALAAAKRAVELDERDAVGHFSLGRAYVLQGQYELGIAELETAIELNPGFAQAYFGLGQALVWANRDEEARPLLEDAIRLSPHDPHRWTFFHLQALAYYKLGKLKDAELCARTSVRLPNATYWAFATLTSILGDANKLDEAAPIIQELLRLKPEYSCSYAADDFLVAGRTIASPQFVKRYVAGLRKAGLPE